MLSTFDLVCNNSQDVADVLKASGGNHHGTTGVSTYRIDACVRGKALDRSGWTAKQSSTIKHYADGSHKHYVASYAIDALDAEALPAYPSMFGNPRMTHY